jgi:hypothetical protein
VPNIIGSRESIREPLIGLDTPAFKRIDAALMLYCDGMLSVHLSSDADAGVHVSMLLSSGATLGKHLGACGPARCFVGVWRQEHLGIHWNRHRRQRDEQNY